MPIKVQIVIHLIQFAPEYNMGWNEGLHTTYSQGEVVNYMTHMG